MAKFLTVVLLVILVAGGLVALWSVEIAPRREADATRLAALEDKIKKLEARLGSTGEGEIGFITSQEDLPALVPFVSRLERLESRVTDMEKNVGGPVGAQPNTEIVSELAAKGDSSAPATTVGLPPGAGSSTADKAGNESLEELAQQDREHIKGAIREVIEEEKARQKFANYEKERDEYRNKILNNIKNAAKEFNLSDYQKQAIKNIVEDAFSQLDIAAEDAKFENNPALIEEARKRLEKEMNDRAIELLDGEQLKKLEKFRAERREKNRQK